jgi:PIN domain nuclease of toxin-antitoxin system
MNILLDTHILLWHLADNPRLSNLFVMTDDSNFKYYELQIF